MGSGISVGQGEGDGVQVGTGDGETVTAGGVGAGKAVSGPDSVAPAAEGTAPTRMVSHRNPANRRREKDSFCIMERPTFGSIVPVYAVRFEIMKEIFEKIYNQEET